MRTKTPNTRIIRRFELCKKLLQPLVRWRPGGGVHLHCPHCGWEFEL